MEVKNRIAVRIHTLRKERKLTQVQLALKSEVNHTFISQVETGARNLSIEALSKILKGISITAREFFALGIVEEPHDWDEWHALQNYIYFDMGNVVYLNSDQPTTCITCGRRTDIVIDFGPSMKNAMLHQCFDRNCGRVFLTEDDESGYD